jgi:hypothetical protein
MKMSGKMDPAENEQATADELVAYAALQGIDLRRFCTLGMFQNQGRWIIVWRKLDSILSSGRPDEPEGTLKYNMQGTIELLPDGFKDSGDAFRGHWSEAGTLGSIAQAFALIEAWLIERKEVDWLPIRCPRRYGI